MSGIPLPRLGAAGPLSLYVHVPFCRRKCTYCDFYSVTRFDTSLLQQVVTATLQQGRDLLDRLQPWGPVESVFVGGGTPSLLGPELLTQLLAGIRDLVGQPTREWSLEANPESLDAEVLQVCSDQGVTRLSLGVQSTADRHLSALERPGDHADTLACLELIGRHWNGRLSLDLLAGIPDQTEAEIREAVGLAAQSGAGHVSFYCLTVEENTALAGHVELGQVRMPDSDRAADLWQLGADLLVSGGYRRYEVSNFARPGQECHHNLRYWHLEPYLGIGPGAVSTLPAAQERGPAVAVRLANPRSVSRFLGGPLAAWGLTVEELGPHDLLLETLMMGLRLAAGIPAELLRQRFGAELQDLLPVATSRWRRLGALVDTPEAWQLTASGRMGLDGLLRAAMDEIAAAVIRRVRWPRTTAAVGQALPRSGTRW